MKKKKETPTERGDKLRDTTTWKMVARLRGAGHTYKEIGEILGFSKQRAWEIAGLARLYAEENNNSLAETLRKSLIKEGNQPCQSTDNSTSKF